MSRDRAHPYVNPNDPQAYGQCDRCMAIVPHRTLQKEMRYAGDSLKWDGLMVCSRPGCMDKPHPQDRVIKLPPDPQPVKNPRPET